VAFDLVSEHRRQLAQEQTNIKQQLQQEKEEKDRYFTAQPIANYERLSIDIMPSQKPSTVPTKPNFASDKLPARKIRIEEPKRESTEPKDFVF